MRHSKRRHVLGVSGPHRSAMLGNLSVALITHGRIKTTLAKAKALRPFIEKVITLAKKAHQANDAARTLHFRRLAISRIRDKKAVAELFDNKVSEFLERAGGYTRIYKLGQRVGDAAEMALIELIDGSDEGYTKTNKKKAAKTKAEVVPAVEAAEPEAAAADAEETTEVETVEGDASEKESVESEEVEAGVADQSESEKED